MLKWLLLVVGIILLALGGEGLAYIFSNPQQLTMRCEEYVRSQSSALWLRLTDCEADYLGAGYRESRGQIAELFFPVRPVGRPRTEPAALVAATKDPEVLAIAQATLGQGRQPDQEQFIVMMLKIITTLRASREVEGWGRAGVFKDFESRRSLASLSSPVEPDALVLDLHARPQPTVPAIATMAGAIALVVALALHLRSRRAAAEAPASETAERREGAAEDATAVDATEPAKTEETMERASVGGETGAQPAVTEEHLGQALSKAPIHPPERAHEDGKDVVESPALGMDLPADLSFAADEDGAPGVEAAASPPPPDAPKLRGLLLLRLPPSADPSDIENAPPLGPRDAVMRRVSEILPQVQFDESGQGRMAGPGYLLVIDFGSEQLVHTAIARAEGAAAIDLLQTLLPSAGWRAYSPRTATFIDAARLHAFATPPGDAGS